MIDTDLVESIIFDEMTKGVRNFAHKIENSEYGHHIYLEGLDLHCTYDNHRILYTAYDTKTKVEKTSKATEVLMENVLMHFRKNTYKYLELPYLYDVADGIKEVSKGWRKKRVVYTHPREQNLHLDARYMGSFMMGLSTRSCYYFDNKHPVFFFEKNSIVADAVGVLLPIDTPYTDLPMYKAI